MSYVLPVLASSKHLLYLLCLTRVTSVTFFIEDLVYVLHTYNNNPQHSRKEEKTYSVPVPQVS